ncbi:MAG: signal recognition particle protein [Armatimonadetes bacterium]|nr:signal recognition particle protein [Armatimonadota bacterium]
MMFESLTQKLQGVFQRLRGKGTLKEQDITEALREVRLALLEADVNFRVARDLCARIKEKAVGQEVLESLTPSQQVIKIVHEELCALLGEDESRLQYASRPPTVILMVGVQGSGKTTTCAKLAHLIRRQGRRSMLVACDIYRPAAIKQLEVVGAQVGVPAFTLGDRTDVVDIARAAVERAREQGVDVLIVDTAGRLHVDQVMMDEVARLEEALQPQEALLVLDAMTGQDAVNIASEFAGRLNITGFILTKLDGDTRGGAALSVRAVSGKPIKFVGVGEKPEMLEPFHPERMASRILGMGDVLSFIERAQQVVDEKEALALEKKIRANRFDLEDFLGQLQNVRKMGPLEQVLGSLPFFGGRTLSAEDVDETELVRFQAIIQSMTREERRDPSILNGSRRRRIARGSGTGVQDVNRLLNQYQQMRKLFQQMNQIESGRKRPHPLRMPFFP